jgi:carbon-monoxide dehydrogenase medium subunit
VLIPPLPLDMTGRYVKFTTGSSEERPCAGVCALARMDKGICRELRLAVGAVSSGPGRISIGEDMARDRNLTDQLIERIAAAASRAVNPIDDVRGPADYKRRLVGVLVRRAIAAVANGNSERSS